LLQKIYATVATLATAFFGNWLIFNLLYFVAATLCNRLTRQQLTN